MNALDGGPSSARARAWTLEERVVRYWDRDIVALARRRGGSATHDAAQEARLRLVRCARKVDSAPSAYVRRVILNSVRATAGRARRMALYEFELDDIGGPVGTDVPEGSDVAKIRRALGTLPAPIVRVYALLYEQDLSQRQAAALLGVTQPRVAQLHQTLLHEVRRALGVLSI